MKTKKLLLSGAIASLLFISACQKSKDILTSNAQAEPEIIVTERKPMGTCQPETLNYGINLTVTPLGNNQWEWLYEVYNPAPGNGTNGTLQDLSHWGFPIGTCVDPNSFVQAAYSSDAINWNYFTPSFQVDNSQNCITMPVLKFNYGTTGGQSSYYKVIVNQEYSIDPLAQAYYKSGVTTGCCVFSFDGMGCPGEGEIR